MHLEVSVLSWVTPIPARKSFENKNMINLDFMNVVSILKRTASYSRETVCVMLTAGVIWVYCQILFRRKSQSEKQNVA
jgi:hypothetical protein